MYTSSQCLCNYFCHSSLSSVKFPLTYNSDSGFLCTFLLPGAKLHLTKCFCAVRQWHPHPQYFSVLFPSFLLTSNFLLVGFGLQSSPFLLSFPFRERIRYFILLCHRVNRIVIPRVPHFDVIVDVSFVGLPPRPDDAVQLRLPFLLFFFHHVVDERRPPLSLSLSWTTWR